MNLLKDNYETGTSCRRSQCLTVRDKCAKIRIALNSTSTNCENLGRSCVVCNVQHVYTNKKWRRVIFTDEKRFNLEGPDGLRCYYRDLRKEQQLWSRRPVGNGYTMTSRG